MSDTFQRAYPLEDIRILSRAQGQEYADGRTVEALVAVWDRGAEIHDGQGDYIESLAPTSFDKAIKDARPQGSRSSWNVGVFYNHGMTLHGTPSDLGSMPIGSPVDIRADRAGLVTVTHYNATPRAEEILEAIRNGDISGHSFSGRFIKSDPARPPRGGFRASNTGFPNVRRLELGLREYGPTPFPAYSDTAVLSVRSFPSATPEEPVDDDTPEEGAVPDEPRDEVEHSSRSQELTRQTILQTIARARCIYPGLARESDDTP